MSNCVCGSFLRRNGEAVDSGAASVMDASFVHLPPSLLVDSDEDRSGVALQQHRVHPLHLEYLESIIVNDDDDDNNEPLSSPPSDLCLYCVQRIETAMEADIQRLESECRLYRNATRDEQTRQASQLRAIQSLYSNNSTDDDDDKGDAVVVMEQTLRNEMHRLADICAQEEAELENLAQLEQEAAATSRQLDTLQWSINEEANALELETHAFENEEQQILTVLTDVQNEVERLSSSGIRFPARALDLRIDARGLRYPLINELRLAYRPKGDVEWEEIQSAWALAAQLLLQSATLLEFQSQHWRIVPLSQCAKIIYHAPNNGENNNSNSNHRRGVTHNVGHPSSKSSQALMAWNALLFEVVQHATATIKGGIEKGLLEAKMMERLPYEQTSQSIGGVPLRHLAVDDDASWSRVVHFMSCNLLWLVNMASLWTLENVILSAVDL